ncbi:branched-chain amino acid transport system permease protein [Pilibacter termitis]|uniref:Branched-chain amino acid transport system permease protein n=1 Tax=Pilibacter termitis TaxID=263852 RepID=A0A1T4NQ71_9ENTE|nr:branched-chain amino acid ABC transporter permease [Pilibacter termitis]SJZ81342.1 branched-chain amino acid transport system permease protein [Pilibacter termitis]
MKKNLKSNILWLALLLLLFGVLSALEIVGVINPFVATTLCQIGINIILAVGLNLIIGFSGQFSLGHAGFMAIGAYSGAIIGTSIPTYAGFFLSVLVGMVLSGIVAFVVGYPTLRLRGDYLAIATLGVSEIIRIMIINLKDITNGPAGLFGIPPFTSWQMVFILMVVTTIFTMNMLRSKTGRAILSVREDEIAAESMGVNTTKFKVLAFVFGAITASIAGSLQAGLIQTVTPKDFSFMKSIDILIIVVFGGMGSMTGTIVAAVTLGLLNNFLQDFSDLRMIIYSLAIILVMILKPSGLLGNKELSLSKIFTKKEEKKA